MVLESSKVENRPAKKVRYSSVLVGEDMLGVEFIVKKMRCSIPTPIQLS